MNEVAGERSWRYAAVRWGSASDSPWSSAERPCSSSACVTVASVAGLSPSEDGGYAHYGAAKAAIAHYTKYLAQDLGPYGITANCIAPGIIPTGRIAASVMPGSAYGNRDQSERIASVPRPGIA